MQPEKMAELVIATVGFFVLLVFCQFSELNWLMEASLVPEISMYRVIKTDPSDSY